MEIITLGPGALVPLIITILAVGGALIGPLLTIWGVVAAVRWSRRLEANSERMLDAMESLRVENAVLREKIEALEAGEGAGPVSLPPGSE